MVESQGLANAVRRRDVRIGIAVVAALAAVVAGAGAANGILVRHDQRVETETAAADGRSVPIQVDATRHGGDAPRLAGQIPTMNWSQMAAKSATAASSPAGNPIDKAYLEQQKRDDAASAADQRAFEARLRAWAEPFLPAVDLAAPPPASTQRLPARPAPQMAQNDGPGAYDDRGPASVFARREGFAMDARRTDGEDGDRPPPARRRLAINDSPVDAYDYYARFSRYRRSEDPYGDRRRDQAQDDLPPWVARRPPPPPPPGDDGW